MVKIRRLVKKTFQTFLKSTFAEKWLVLPDLSYRLSCYYPGNMSDMDLRSPVVI